jgi:DNA polymerase-3 subunit gamma/tau
MELSSLIHRIALAQMAPQAIADEVERARLLVYASAFDAEYLQLAYQIIIHCRGDLHLAPDEYSGFTMCLLRLHAFRPMMPPALAAGGEGRNPGTTRPQGRAAAPVAPAVAAASAPVAAPMPERVAAVPAAQEFRPPAQVSAPVSVQVTPPAVMSPREEDQAPTPEDDWHELLSRLDVGGLARELGQHCELLSVSGDLVKLRLNIAHRQLLLTSAPADKLQSALSGRFGRPMRLQVDLGETQAETPAQRAAGERMVRHARAVEALEQDGFVREVIELFDATLNESTIKPL